MDRLFNFSLKTKKRWTNVSTGLFFLFGGIEYAIIMPTVFLYIQELGGNPSFLGLVLSAFSFTGLLAAPVFGLLQDKYQNTKLLVLVANCFEIVGNFMYLIAKNLLTLLGSRLIAGIGAGVGSSLFAQIARTTTETERAAAISMAMAARQIGLLFGPGLNLFLKDFDFHLGPWHVDAYSSAGLFMCILWILLQIFILFFYFDLPPLSEEAQRGTSSQQDDNPSNKDIKPQHVTQSKHLSNSVNVLISGRPRNNNKSVFSQSLPASGLAGSFEEGGIINIAPMWGSSTIVGDARPRAFSTNVNNRELINPSDNMDVKQDVMENVDLDGDDLYDPPEVQDGLVNQGPGLNPVSEDEEQQNGSSGYGSTGQGVASLSDENNVKPGRTWQEEYLREEIVVLLASTFIFFFNQTVLETALTPMTQRLLNFGELENSVLYCICGAEVVIGFIVVKYLSKFVSDRVMLLTGFIIELISCVWLLIFYPNASPDEPYENVVWAILGILSVVAGLPFLMVATITLYSRLTSIETQGFSQGIRRAVGGVATIMGPLWAGSTVEMGYVMFGVMNFLFAFIILLMLLSWDKLQAPADLAKKEAAAKSNLVPSLDDSNDETSPLLINASDDEIEA